MDHKVVRGDLSSLVNLASMLVMSPDAIANLVASVVNRVGLDGQICHASLFARDFHLSVEPDRAELERRRRFGLEAITDRRLLRQLSDLPHMEPVARTSVRVRGLQILEGAPSGVVELGDTYVKRLARPAVRLVGAVAVDDDWDRGLNRASRLAAFCPRVLAWLSTSSGDRDAAVTEARFYGIGLVVFDGESLHVEVAPEIRHQTFGAASWRVREEVLAGTRTGEAVA